MTPSQDSCGEAKNPCMGGAGKDHEVPPSPYAVEQPAGDARVDECRVWRSLTVNARVAAR